jgi:hypothetical protein
MGRRFAWKRRGRFQGAAGEKTWTKKGIKPTKHPEKKVLCLKKKAKRRRIRVL